MPELRNFKFLQSPPHTRGIQVVVASLWGQLGITPSYEGNTNNIVIDCFFIGDHPLIRGEYRALPWHVPGRLGSPPHTRGILIALVVSVVVLRITPSYEGNTPALLFSACASQDHPLIRGECKESFNDSKKAMGSPPHTRGIPLLD